MLISELKCTVFKITPARKKEHLMPGMSLIQASLCVLGVPALLTLRQDGCHTLLGPLTECSCYTMGQAACYGVFLCREHIILVLLCLHWLVICSMSKSQF